MEIAVRRLDLRVKTTIPALHSRYEGLFASNVENVYSMIQRHLVNDT